MGVVKRAIDSCAGGSTGSTTSTLLHDRINPKDCQVLSLGDTGFLQFFRVVSRDYGKPRSLVVVPLRELTNRSPLGKKENHRPKRNVFVPRRVTIGRNRCLSPEISITKT